MNKSNKQKVMENKTDILNCPQCGKDLAEENAVGYSRYVEELSEVGYNKENGDIQIEFKDYSGQTSLKEDFGFYCQNCGEMIEISHDEVVRHLKEEL
jgi:predicted RNA-binding Zn-ribbon protein involved in translation (DUF1610 family)